jgi:cytochrome c553
MKRILILAMMLIGAAGLASAQIQAPTSDVLGAHLNYGRGCAGCHAPHSGAFGNGANHSGDKTSGSLALWGEDAGNLYGQTLLFGDGGRYSETLPASLTAGTPDVSGVLMCLTCHDGNLAQGAMMKNQVYETLPKTYGTFNTVPTLLGNDGTSAGNYINDHPVGLNVNFGCGGAYNWDCTIAPAPASTTAPSQGTVLMTGPNSSAFVKNYGFFVSLPIYNNKPVVVCTSCHNQHSMNVVAVKGTISTTNGQGSGLPAGNYATMFFLRGPYNPASGTAGSNQTAQFCRQCHGGEANESNGSYNIPTTF